MESTKKIEDDKVWCTVSCTVNLGNYNNVKIESGLSKTYGNKDPFEVQEKLFQKLSENVKKQSKQLKKKFKLNG